MALIFSFLKKYKVAAIAALVMMLIELTVELSQPLIISKIIDLGIREKDTSVVWLWGSILIGSAVVAFTAGVLSSFLLPMQVRALRSILGTNCTKRYSLLRMKYSIVLLPRH